MLAEGFDPAYGARPLRRTVQRLVQDPLAIEILEGTILPGDRVLVDADAATGAMKFERRKPNSVAAEPARESATAGSPRSRRWLSRIPAAAALRVCADSFIRGAPVGASARCISPPTASNDWWGRRNHRQNEGIMRALKTGFLLTVLTLLLVVGGRALAGPQGMTFGLVLAMAMNGMAYFFSDKIALASSGAQPVSREQLPRLYEVMERLAAKGQLPMPKLYIIPQEAPNAFATGRNPSHASVAVTQGLLELMTDDELEGVIAHELSHVRNYDILTTSIAATLAGAITWMANIGRWGMMFGGYGGGGRDDRRGGGLGDLLMLFIAPIAAMVIQLGISRQREFAADASGARLVGQQYGLISALEKLGAYNNRIPMTNVSPTTASLYIVKPLGVGQFLGGLFSTHPPLADRIAALRQMTVTR